MGKQDWVYRWRKQVKLTRFPGVWKVKEGGCLVRARVKDPTTGRMREIKKVLPRLTELQALARLEEEKERVRSGHLMGAPQSVRFSDFALSVLESKIAKGELNTPPSQDRWKYTLEHLVAGTTSEDGEIQVMGFGDMFVSRIALTHVENWKVGVGRLIQAGHYSPNTVNSWLAILRTVLKAAQRQLDLPRVATDGVPNFDVSNHETYSEEEPNALSPEQVPRFLEVMLSEYPQHFAMAYLSIATGLRPSSVRPLRRGGETPDIQWEARRLLVRRSQTRGDSVRNSTKQGTRYAIDLPDAVIEVLKWHVDSQLETDEQRASELLFPSLSGGFRSATVLTKPFADVSRRIGLGYVFTPRGMRRTFNDLAREAQVKDLVTRSISGHATETMQRHYSSVRSEEKREGVAKVTDLMAVRLRRAKQAVGTVRSEHHLDAREAADTSTSPVPSGARGGAQPSGGGAQNEKAS